MSIKELSPEEISANFDKFRSFCEKLGDRSETVLKMVDELSERLALAPASGSPRKHSAFAGGLIHHTLNVLKNILIVNKAFKWDLPQESMIIVALFHDLGKVGLPGGSENDFYLPQTDDWRRNKLGEMYMYNNNMTFMETGDRTMFVLQHYGIKLTPDEWVAIKTSDGYVVEENRKYCLKVSNLTTAVQIADYCATQSEKE